jgi:hypothetical protein
MYRDSGSFFISFVNALNSSETKNIGNADSNFLLIKKLLKFEQKAKDIIFSGPDGQELAKQFILQFTKTEPNNTAVSIKYGNVYFRERQGTYYKEIAPAIRQNKISKILKYRINYNFIKWALDNFQGKRSQKLKLKRCFDNIIKIRERLVLDNAYIVLNRVRIMSASHVDYSLKYLDVVQSCFVGLMEAVDNFVPNSRGNITKKDTINFIPVVICRVTLNFRDINNTSLLKASTKDWRIIYRIKLAIKNGHSSVEDIYQFVSESFPDLNQDIIITNMQFIDGVKYSAYINKTEEEGSEQKSPVDQYVIENYQDSLDKIDENHDYTQLSRSIGNLTILEQKCILLKYGKLFS